MYDMVRVFMNLLRNVCHGDKYDMVRGFAGTPGVLLLTHSTYDKTAGVVG